MAKTAENPRKGIMSDCSYSWDRVLFWPGEGAWRSRQVLEQERGMKVAAIPVETSAKE